MGKVSFPFDDALVLVELGTPRWLLCGLGIPLFLWFFVLFVSFLEGIGLKREESIVTWLATIGCALVGYLVFGMLLRIAWLRTVNIVNPGPIFVLAATAIVIPLAACSWIAAQWLPKRTDTIADQPGRWKSISVCTLGIAFMAIEILFFSPDISEYP